MSTLKVGGTVDQQLALIRDELKLLCMASDYLLTMSVNSYFAEHIWRKNYPTNGEAPSIFCNTLCDYGTPVVQVIPYKDDNDINLTTPRSFFGRCILFTPFFGGRLVMAEAPYRNFGHLKKGCVMKIEVCLMRDEQFKEIIINTGSTNLLLEGIQLLFGEQIRQFREREAKLLEIHWRSVTVLENYLASLPATTAVAGTATGNTAK